MAENELFSSTHNGKLHFSTALGPDSLRPRSIHLVKKHRPFPQWRCSLEIQTGEHPWFMPSQQQPGPRKQSGKPDEGDQRVLEENADQQGPRITPQDEQNTALLQHNLPCGKPGLYIWLKQVCDPQGSPEAAEELSPRQAHGPLIRGALLCAHSLQSALTNS